MPLETVGRAPATEDSPLPRPRAAWGASAGPVLPAGWSRPSPSELLPPSDTHTRRRRADGCGLPAKSPFRGRKAQKCGQDVPHFVTPKSVHVHEHSIELRLQSRPSFGLPSDRSAAVRKVVGVLGEGNRSGGAFAFMAAALFASAILMLLVKRPPLPLRLRLGWQRR
jgi:hypothetical protein